MIRINDNFCALPPTYLFTEIARRIEAYRDANPSCEDIIRMGIGDVTQPLILAAINAMHKAVDEMAHSATFRGYGPEQGYAFLRDAIALHDYQAIGIGISPDEIFISDGAKSDTGNFGDILSPKCRVAVTDPVYPVYIDSNVMAGRAGRFNCGIWDNVVYLPCTSENDFIPSLPSEKVDMIYLCYPNNPTGTTLNRAQLKVWVEYAKANGALILFDSAYEAYINDADVPHSIYEIEGADEVAVEFRSFSKTAGFTGVRCGYTVVPKKIRGVDAACNDVSLRDLWNRRQCTKFNGASYISQRGAEALYTKEGKDQMKEVLSYYHTNAMLLRNGLSEAGLKVWGGDNSPYIWMKTPDGMTSWEFFDYLLDRCHVVGTPGSGFGPSGEGYFRLTAFNTAELTREAVERIKKLL